MCGVEESPFLREPTFTSTTWTERHTPFAVNRVIVTRSEGLGFLCKLCLQVFACDSFEGFPDDVNYAILNPTYFDVRNLVKLKE